MKMSLKNKKEINKLFESGKSVSGGLVFAKVLDSGSGFLFAVSSKKFKRAVDRNRIKRLMRECVKGKVINKSVAFIYMGDKLPSFVEVELSINKILSKI